MFMNIFLKILDRKEITNSELIVKLAKGQANVLIVIKVILRYNIDIKMHTYIIQDF